MHTKVNIVPARREVQHMRLSASRRSRDWSERVSQAFKSDDRQEIAAVRLAVKHQFLLANRHFVRCSILQDDL